MESTVNDKIFDKHQLATVLGCQWGDEGKGKLVDILSRNANICARFNGGANAGHTIVVNEQVIALHLIPCGIVNEKLQNLIGNGTVIHLKSFFHELDLINEVLATKSNDDSKNKDKSNHAQNFSPLLKRIFISSRAHLLFDIHRLADEIEENDKLSTGSEIGTTKSGIGPCYSTKIARIGLRVGDLLDWNYFVKNYIKLINAMKKIYGCQYDYQEELSRHHDYAEILRGQIIDSVTFMHNAVNDNKKILLEGANATMLDIDFGSYPYVTSSTTTVGGISTGLGIPPKFLPFSVGVCKSYTTRVGSGPFPTEIFDDRCRYLQSRGKEYGSTTNRLRRCGWLDLQIVRYSNCINGYNCLNLTKLDVLSGIDEILLCIAYKKKTGEKYDLNYIPSVCSEYDDIIPVYERFGAWDGDISNCRKFSDLPENAKLYIDAIEKYSGIEIKYIGVGPKHDQLVVRD